MSIFESTKKSNFKSKSFCWAFNFFPTYRNTGGRVRFISADFREVHVRLKLNWRTRNYVGTTFGGSLAAAADPFYMIQLMKILGENYVVWDKAAHVRFKRPGDQTLYIRFLITDEILDAIKKRAKEENEFDLELKTDWINAAGKVYANVTKTLYIANKAFYKNKKTVKKS